MEVKLKFVGKCLLIEVKRKRILVVGDLHLGYEEFLNRGGVFVTREMMREVIREIAEVFERVGNVDKIVLLGDVKHNFGRIVKQEWEDAGGLIDYLMEKAKEVIIIKGNHDKILEPIAEKKGIEVRDYFIFDEIAFLHGDRDFSEIHDRKIKYWVMGHGHPAVKLRERGGAKMEKYKCFLVGKFKGREIIILPSFFSGNEGSDPRENDLGLAWKFNL